jgi:Patatin-like phospholipase
VTGCDAAVAGRTGRAGEGDDHMEPLADTRPTCDVVLKGGITSGVVYPTLLCELARRYRLVNIGGASAGAIAAAVAAAAEYGQQHGGRGYAVLAELPHRLAARDVGGGTALAGLFEPQTGTRPLMAVLKAAQAGGAVRATVVGLGAELGSASWWRVLLPAVPGALVVLGALLGSVGPWQVVLLALGVALAVVGLVAGTAWALVRRLLTAVPANLLGLVDGSGSAAALTPWLARTIDEAAGHVGGPPLTLADLWGATDPQAKVACLRDRDRRRINLEVMTTNLGEGRPQRLPALTDEWYFHEGEFRRLFGDRIVETMVAATTPRGGTAADDREHDLHTLLARAQGYHRLPRADLPVVVAARLSLSFPVLVSAVPLYKVDFSRSASAEAVATWRAWLREHREEDLAEHLDAGPRLPLSRCWISDGGITSNMPVHFFDAPLPKRPTFLVNLRAAVDGADRPDVAVAADNQQGLEGARTGLGDEPPTVPHFVAAIVRTMQNWVDNAQMRMPGYRDRIVTVYLGKGEGGLNLQMPGPLVDELAKRGGRAAGLLVARYADPPATGWHNHRWVRFRSLMAMLEPLFGQVTTAWSADPGVPVPTYAQMLDQVDHPPSYRFPARALPWVRARAGQVVELAAHWPDPVDDGRGRPVTGSFEHDAPRPRSVWRGQPEL